MGKDFDDDYYQSDEFICRRERFKQMMERQKKMARKLGYGIGPQPVNWYAGDGGYYECGEHWEEQD
jgi:hypothetical protein